MTDEDNPHTAAVWRAAERLYYDGQGTLRGVRFENLSDEARQGYYDLADAVVWAYLRDFTARPEDLT